MDLEDFNKRIQQIQDYIETEDQNMDSSFMSSLMTIIQFTKSLKNLKSLNDFFNKKNKDFKPEKMTEINSSLRCLEKYLSNFISILENSKNYKASLNKTMQDLFESHRLTFEFNNLANIYEARWVTLFLEI